jgi:hypothetical protein
MMREILPGRRANETFEFHFQHINYTATVSRYADGRLAEVFIDCAKHTSQAAALARDAAVVLSIALQRGVPVEELRTAITRLEDGSAAGIVGKILDVIAEGI